MNRLQSKLSRIQDRRNLAKVSKQISSTVKPEKTAPPVIFFNTSTRIEQLSLNAGFSLLTAWSLLLDGHPVEFFCCDSGMRRCLLGTYPNRPDQAPPCGKCVSQSRSMYPGEFTHSFGFFPDAELEKRIRDASLAEMLALTYHDLPLGELIGPSLRWILRRQNLADDGPTCSICRDYLLSAYSLAGEFAKVLDKKGAAAVVVFNGQFFPEATVKYLAKKRGIRVISHEVALQPFCAFFTDGEATAYPIHIPEEFRLSAEQNRRLDEVLEKRFQGNFSMAGIDFWPEMKSFDDTFWKRADSFDQIVPVFTNVIFDTSQAHANVLYPDMFAWLEDVSALIRENPRTFFVIRAHPDENRRGKEARESVSAWIKERNIDSLPNVLFVGPEESFSSYELILKSKFVMVYNSTIGLEASILGAAVLCAGKARFTQVESVYFPKSRQQYLESARALLSAAEVTPPEYFRSNARKFLYFQLFRTSLPFSDFLESSDYWKGYVKLKDFSLDLLRAKNSKTMQVIQAGILSGKEFLMPEN